MLMYLHHSLDYYQVKIRIVMILLKVEVTV